jgi:hypothetical protein
MRVSLFLLLTLPFSLLIAAEDPWTTLAFDKDLTVWKPIRPGGYVLAAEVAMDEKNPRMLVGKDTGNVFVTMKGCPDLITKEKFGDVEVQAEFLIPKGSNSGIKLNGQYEIQIRDTAGAKELTGDSLGGIYPKAELGPPYRYLDKGVAPKVNAAKPAGEWQSLHIIFRAPRFEGEKKVANAKFVKVVLNGQLIHENQEVDAPTGAAYKDKESATGPLLLQTDHGGVAFRNVKIRPLGK